MTWKEFKLQALAIAVGKRNPHQQYSDMLQHYPPRDPRQPNGLRNMLCKMLVLRETINDFATGTMDKWGENRFVTLYIQKLGDLKLERKFREQSRYPKSNHQGTAQVY